jgi:hypothetical protein
MEMLATGGEIDNDALPWYFILTNGAERWI